MGNSKKNATSFRPGSLWRNEAAKLSDEERSAWSKMRETRKSARRAFSEAFDRIRTMTRVELETLCKTKTANVVELVVARTVLRTIAGGQILQFTGLVEAWCGPEPKQVELSGPGGAPLSPASTLTVDELVRVYRELDQLAKGTAECNSTKTSSPPSLPSPASPRRSSDTE